jgi:hypothetical protein
MVLHDTTTNFYVYMKALLARDEWFGRKEIMKNVVPKD